MAYNLSNVAFGDHISPGGVLKVRSDSLCFLASFYLFDNESKDTKISYVKAAGLETIKIFFQTALLFTYFLWQR